MRWITNGSEVEDAGPVRWECKGCGWTLYLRDGVAPPMAHTLNYPIGTPRPEMKDCEVRWQLIARTKHFL